MMLRTALRRTLVIAGSAVLVLVIGLRIVPLLAPWTGRSALDGLQWSTVYLDRHGRALQVRPVDDDGLRRIYLPVEEIPSSHLRVIRLSEDRRFFIHPGFDALSLARAGFHYWTDSGLSGGGSTITMQLVRMLQPRAAGESVTVGLKMREVWGALQIESRMTKREILELYVNLVPFGRNIQGYPAAAQLFFGRPMAELTVEEMCVLSVIPRSPVLYDPLSRPKHHDPAAERLARDVLGPRFRQGSIEDVRPASLHEWPFHAPHFIEMISSRIEGTPGIGTEPIRTTLDLDMHREAGRLLRHHVGLAEDFRISNGAMILADRTTMDVLAYLGSADFHDDKHSGQIDGVRMRREPGSTLKPFLYAGALDTGWTASTILPDIPLEFGREEIYTPRNYDQQFHGPVRLRQALSASLNVPAVYALERMGVDRFTDMLISAGFESLEGQKGRLGVSLALGGGEVSLGELVQGYGGLASGGVVRPLNFFLDDRTEGQRVWSLESADIITDIISGSDDMVMTFGRGGAVRYDYPAAIKTGTSNQFNNIWAVGFTADLLGGVWMGNFDGSTVVAAPGSSLPARLLHDAFDRWSSRGDINRHSQLEEHLICSISGLMATPRCPYTMPEYFTFDTVPGDCDWHVDGRGGVVLRYPQEYMQWAGRYGYDVEFSRNAGLGILHPADGAVYFREPGVAGPDHVLRISITGTGEGQLGLNGYVLYQGTLPAQVLWPMEPGSFELVLENADSRVRRRFEVH